MAHLFTDRTFAPIERFVAHKGTRVQTSLVKVLSEIVRADTVLATLVTILANAQVILSSGYVHGNSTEEYMPSYLFEVSILHALLVLREWAATVDQTLLQNSNILAGDARTCYRIRARMAGSICTLSPVKA